MSLRDRLLALLRAPDYHPANEYEIARRLDLKKKERGALAHEVRLALKSGEFARAANGRIAPRGQAERARPADTRKIFAPTRRGGSTVGAAIAALPPPLAPIARAGGAPEALPTADTVIEPVGPTRRRQPETPRLRGGELVGKIQFRAGGSAFVIREGAERSEPALQVFPEDTGVALPGDRVIARVFPGRHGKRPGEKIGGVVRVLERDRETIVGNLKTGRRGFIVQPDDPRFTREIAVSDPAKTRLKPAPKPGDKVIVKLHEWRDPRDQITGTLISRLGRTHEPRAELLGVFHKYNLATEFPPDVEREAETLPSQVGAREAEAPGRLDYRDKPVFTIDPDDAKDFDDALSYETLPSGEVRVGIHIADVSTYVRPGTALDREAQKRGNSTYLVGVVIPMLPEKLSNGLCSLVENQDRLCKAVFLTFGKNGKITDTSFANTVIRSRKRLTYKQAYAFLFVDSLQKIRALPLPAKHQTGSTGRALRELGEQEMRDLQTWIRALWKIASRLRKDRMAHGSLDLDMPETKIFVDPEGYADRLEKIEHDESHQLIEEFMLAANEAVARLTRTRSLASLYRVHDEPDVEKLEEFRGLLDTFGVRVGDLTQRAELVRLLKVLDTHPQGYTLRTQLLRSLKKAAYRASPDGHFGLNKKDYTHFTSPIRRYADLVVHRVLESHLATSSKSASSGKKGAKAPGSDARATSRRAHAPRYDLPGIERIGEHISLTEINSAEAERESVKIKLLEFFERELDKKPPTRFAAVITDVRTNGFFVELIESMTFGFVSYKVLSDDYYSLDDDGTALIGRRTRKRYALNQRLDVVVEAVDRFKRLIDFRPA